MGFGDFLRGIAAQVNPFDNGKTYGSYNPPKKRDDQFGSGSGVQAAPTSAPQSNPLQVQAPQNHFQTGLTAPTLPGAPHTGVNLAGQPTNVAPLFKPTPTTPATPPQPQKVSHYGDGSPIPANVSGVRGSQNGQNGVVTINNMGHKGFVPDAPAPAKPTGFWGHVGNGFKTAGETAVGTVENIPEAGLAVARAGTGLVQGVGQVPHIATAAVATGTKELQQHMNNSVTRQINRGAQDINTGTKVATHYAIDDALDPINRNLDAAARGYEHIAPGDAGGANAYRYTQIPINALAAILTGGASAGAEGAAGAGEAGANAGRIASVVNKFRELMNTPLTSNADNIVSRTAQTVSRNTTPVVHAVNSPIKSVTNGVTRLLGRNAPAVNDVVDAGEGANVVNAAEDVVKPPTQIQVQQPTPIDVNAPPSEPTPVPVNVTPKPTGQPIVEVGGDTPGQVKIPTADEVAASRARNAFDNRPSGAPDRSVDGVSPANIGNTGVFTKAEVARERQALDDALKNGEINKTAHKAANAELDGLNVHDAPAKGTPIQVKSVDSIPVEDKSVVPTDLPETPGKVRVTTAKAPSVTKAEAIAAKQTPPITNVHELSKAAKNSLENDTTGIKPNGVERSGARVENATSKPVEYRTHEDGSVSIVDGRHTLEYARQNGISDYPMKDVTDQYTPKAAQPADLPQETQHILDNPKQYNKAQVAAARNQRKLANQLAKAKEGTAAAATRIETASPIATSDEGHVATGQFDTSANGGSYQTASRAAERQQAASESAQMSPADAIQTARKNATENGAYTRRDIRNIRAMFDAKRIPKGTPEYNEARQILKEDGTLSAQALALRGGNTIRRTASPDELMSHFETKIYRLANDPSKIDSKAFDDVEAATNKFTDARDAATQAYNRFTEAPTSQNAKVYHAAQDMADQADKEAKMTEYKVAQKLLKGNKDAKQVREIQKMAHDADMGQMDSIDASMLSGTGTFARNFVNSAVGGTEEGLFGGLASRIANKITGENVGGGFGRGSLSGFGKGVHNLVDASKARAADAGWNPLEHAKNWATTGNQTGDAIIDSQVTHNVLDHYTQDLKSQGYTGRELRDRAAVQARQDPDNVANTYRGYAKAAAGLGSGITKGGKIETIVKNAISDGLSFGNPNRASEAAAKLITRMTVGFPSAVGRTIAEGGKRATLGVPTALRLFTKAARDDPAVRAQIIKESIKQAGSGATTGAIFYKLGQEGLITGSYPSDPNERARWQREGITENSIKIGDNYYQLPSYLGSAALPAMFAATVGRNNGDISKSAGEVAKAIPSILPTSTADNLMQVINGKSDPIKYATSTAASAVRAVTPVGALLNQVAKSFDSTENDTNSADAIHNFLDKVYSGIPGVNNAANIPSKTDDAGNVLHNPGALPLAFGASSTTQDKGVAQTNATNDQTNSDLQAIRDTGAFDDSNIKAVVGSDEKAQKIYTAIASGKQVTPAELKTLRSAMAKGVPSNGDDTAYLEKGQYDSNLAALNVKRTEMAADPTTKPSDLAKIDLNIKRGQVYKDNKIPYSDVTLYKGTSLSDWRSMGDEKSDNYDPDTYQKLWQMDQLMTKAGASDNTKDPTNSKFSAKQAGAGRGAPGTGSYSSAFGQLKAGTGAPTVQNYQTISQSAGAVPVIQAVQPNIVHKVGFSG